MAQGRRALRLRLQVAFTRQRRPPFGGRQVQQAAHVLIQHRVADEAAGVGPQQVKERVGEQAGGLVGEVVVVLLGQHKSLLFGLVIPDGAAPRFIKTQVAVNVIAVDLVLDGLGGGALHHAQQAFFVARVYEGFQHRIQVEVHDAVNARVGVEAPGGVAHGAQGRHSAQRGIGAFGLPHEAPPLRDAVFARARGEALIQRLPDAGVKVLVGGQALPDQAGDGGEGQAVRAQVIHAGDARQVGGDGALEQGGPVRQSAGDRDARAQHQHDLAALFRVVEFQVFPGHALRPPG